MSNNVGCREDLLIMGKKILIECQACDSLYNHNS